MAPFLMHTPFFDDRSQMEFMSGKVHATKVRAAQRGASLIEHALLLTCIVVVVVPSAKQMGLGISEALQRSASDGAAASYMSGGGTSGTTTEVSQDPYYVPGQEQAESEGIGETGAGDAPELGPPPGWGG